MSTNIRILIIEDDDLFREALEYYLKDSGFFVISANNADNALKLIQTNHFDLAIVDFRLPVLNGIDLFGKIKEKLPDIEGILMTGHATYSSAVQAGRAGIYDYISKPFLPEKIIEIIQRMGVKYTSTRGANQDFYSFTFDDKPLHIVSKSPKMKQILDLVTKIATTESTVLILGESGTGKELIAKAIHAKSKRSKMPFFAMDCGSLVESLFESELFGHAKGSFTGAHVTKHGTFELANKGTFFFDEIGNISLNIQAKILRALQEREIRRVGDTVTIKVDVRVLAATNIDLKKAVDEGTFREDLFYRLSVIPVELPPLRERVEDIPLLVEYFIQKHNYRRHGKNIDAIDKNALSALEKYHWPGNIRELENIIERALIIENTSNIGINSLPAFIQSINNQDSGLLSLSENEKKHIANVLLKTERNISHAAKILGIDRKTLYEKIKRYEI